MNGESTEQADATAYIPPPEIMRIPDRLNAVICILQLTVIFTCFWATKHLNGWAFAGLAATFAIFMIGVFSIIHEAQHGVLFTNKRLNTIGGIVMTAFFSGPFHLLRQGHIGHHQRNRSDDEAFDLWFEGESPVWKWVQWIGILTGGFYVMVVLGNIVVLILPFLLKRKWFRFDRPTAAFMDSLNTRYIRIIQLEAIGVILLHVSIVWFMQIPPWKYLVLYGAFGFLWSALQYLHHYNTERHVVRGARNVWIGWPIDWLWLQHNWHLVHHQYPTVSWIHLKRLGGRAKREFLPWVYIRMWAGPRKAKENVVNRHAGEVIR